MNASRTERQGEPAAPRRVKVRAKLCLLVLSSLALAGCTKPGPTTYQGYFEGEFVYLASPLAGHLDQLMVQKGARVTAGTPLFALEQGSERASLRESTERARQAQARLADLRKGQRPTELAALEARVAQARTAADFSALELARNTKLHAAGTIPTEEYDRVRLNHAANLSAIDEATAQLETARLGGRADIVAAAEAEAAAAQAALDRAGWAVAQKNQSAPRDGLVYDTLYRQGEFVAAAAPVVVLLPPENIKVRFFVPEADFSRLKAGATVRVALSGRDQPLEARISYLSPQPEYTPPVLYNRENRAKLVFMVEATMSAADARDLHPGQPVEVIP